MRRLRPALALVLMVLLATPVRASSERELGRRFLLQVRAQLPLVDDPALVEAVRSVGGRIIAALGPQEFDYHFYVVRHPSLNAFAVPGGYLFVFSGLVARATSEDELAGVLGHEAAHVQAHHIVRQQQAGAPWTVAALAGLLLSAIHPALAAGAIAAAQTAQLKYSREFEQEADYIGLRITREAGFDPRALGGFFKQLLSDQRLNPVNVPPWLLTHPVTEERVANVDAVIASQRLVIPRGRPASPLAFEEARAVARAASEPADVVLAEYRKRAEAQPRDPAAQFLLGRVAQQLGQLAVARTALERCRGLGGLDGRVDRPLGSVLRLAKDHTGAAEALRRHLARRPDDAWGHAELGKALLEGGDPAEALMEFRRAIRLDPELDDAHRQIGLVLGRQGKEGEGFYHLAMGERLRGELQEAASHFQRASVLLDEDSPLQRDIDEALDELEPLVRDILRQERESNRRRRRP